MTNYSLPCLQLNYPVQTRLKYNRRCQTRRGKNLVPYGFYLETICLVTPPALPPIPQLSWDNGHKQVPHSYATWKCHPRIYVPKMSLSSHFTIGQFLNCFVMIFRLCMSTPTRLTTDKYIWFLFKWIHSWQNVWLEVIMMNLIALLQLELSSLFELSLLNVSWNFVLWEPPKSFMFLDR